jgi:hypothetical protein
MLMLMLMLKDRKLLERGDCIWNDQRLQLGQLLGLVRQVKEGRRPQRKAEQTATKKTSNQF